MGSRVTDLAELTNSGVLSGVAARERTLPVLAAFGELLPQAVVQRGSVIGCEGSAAVSLALALAAGPSRDGAWVGVAGLPEVGVAAAVELGVVPERLVMVAEPAQPFEDARWAEVLAAMIDGFDVLLLGAGAQQVRSGTARRLVARLQARGAVAISLGASTFGADLRFDAVHTEWQGLGDGHGVARGRQVRVEVSGRRVPRPRRADLWLPAADGQVQPVEPSAADVTEVAPVVASVVALRRTG